MLASNDATHAVESGEGTVVVGAVVVVVVVDVVVVEVAVVAVVSSSLCAVAVSVSSLPQAESPKHCQENDSTHSAKQAHASVDWSHGHLPLVESTSVAASGAFDQCRRSRSGKALQSWRPGT